MKKKWTFDCVLLRSLAALALCAVVATSGCAAADGHSNEGSASETNNVLGRNIPTARYAATLVEQRRVTDNAVRNILENFDPRKGDRQYQSVMFGQDALVFQIDRLGRRVVIVYFSSGNGQGYLKAYPQYRANGGNVWAALVADPANMRLPSGCRHSACIVP